MLNFPILDIGIALKLGLYDKFNLLLPIAFSDSIMNLSLFYAFLNCIRMALFREN